MRLTFISFVLFALALTGCPQRHDPPASQRPAQQAAVTAAVADDDPVDDDPEPGLDDPGMGEAPAAPLDVDHMSDDELQTACFEGRQAACDQLGH